MNLLPSVLAFCQERIRHLEVALSTLPEQSITSQVYRGRLEEVKMIRALCDGLEQQQPVWNKIMQELHRR